MSEPRNSLLYDYVRGSRPGFTLAGVRHRARPALTARAAREIFEAEKGRSAETWLSELRRGMHDVHGWLHDQMVAESIAALDPRPETP